LLEVSRLRWGLDLHVDQLATHGMGKAVPGLHFAADALHLPTMALIEAPAFVAPHFTLAARPQRQMIVADHDRILNRSGNRQGGACRCTAFNQRRRPPANRRPSLQGGITTSGRTGPSGLVAGSITATVNTPVRPRTVLPAGG